MVVITHRSRHTDFPHVHPLMPVCTVQNACLVFLEMIFTDCFITYIVESACPGFPDCSDLSVSSISTVMHSLSPHIIHYHQV